MKMSMTKTGIILLLFVGAMTLFAAPRLQNKLLLPEKIYAVPGIECNIYYRNIFLTINPANFIYDVKCKKGRCDEKRWRFTPKKTDVGSYELSLKVYDDNGVVAEGKSTIIVSPADAGKGKEMSILIAGSSSISMHQAYPTHIYNLFKAPGNPKLTMIGETGPRKDDKLGEIRHEGYGGWSFLTFTTAGRKRVKGRNNMRENPFWNFETKSLDFAAYFKKNNKGKAPDFFSITLGGNDTFRGTDETIDGILAEMRKRILAFMTALRKDAPNARIAFAIFDYSDANQDAFGCNYGAVKHRWEYQKNYHRYMKMLQKLVKEHPELKLDLFLGHYATDNENNGYLENPYANARNKRVKVRSARNALHPREAGYQQGADAFYCWVKYVLHQQDLKNAKVPAKKIKTEGKE